MSTKYDLIRRSGPLGNHSKLDPKVVEMSTEPQTEIMKQNEEQLSKIDNLTGKVEEGFRGANERMDRIERFFDERLKLLESFNDRFMLILRGLAWLPKIFWAVITFLGIDLLTKWVHAL